jgi:hypothetical protein
MYLELTGTLTAARVLEVPNKRKLYFVYNNTTGGFAVTVKVSSQTGVSVPAGSKLILVCNGTDIVTATTYGTSAGTVTSVSASVPSAFSVNVTNSTTTPAIAISYSGTALPVANGGSGATTLTGYLYGNGTGAFTASATIPAGSVSGLAASATTNTTDAANISTGTLATARLGSGTANATTYLRGDQTWAAVSAGGGGTVTSVSASVPSAFSVTVTTPSTTPAIAISYSGTAIPVASGGTGVTTATANQVFAAPSGLSGAPSFRALASADIPNNAANTLGTAAGLSSTLAITSGGTGASTALANQVFAAPSGTSGAPSFRVLASSDIPNNAANTTGSSGTCTGNALSATTAAGLSSTLAITSGGTGQITANNALNALLPSQTTNSGKYLTTNGTNTSWATVSGGGGGTVTSVTNPVVPGFLSSSILTDTTTPAITIGYSGTALPVANGGTGYTTAQAAINNLVTSVTTGYYLRGNGSNAIMSAIQAADVPTLNQNTTGSSGTCTGNALSATTAAGLSSTLAVGSGGTGATTFTAGLLKGNGTLAFTTAAAGTDYVIPSGNITGTAAGLSSTLAVASGGTGASTALANQVFAAPSGLSGAPSFRVLASADIPNNAANTLGTAAGLSSTLAVASGGTNLTSFTTNGAVYATSTSVLTTGTLPVASGGTGATTLTGIVKGSGTSAFTAAIAGTDYVAPGGALGTPSSGNLSNCTADGTNALGYLGLPTSASTTLVTGDRGKCVLATSTITVPNATFSAGDVVTIFNNSAASISISSSLATALYQAGTANVGGRTLAQRGLATIYFVNGTTAVISGAGLT